MHYHYFENNNIKVHYYISILLKEYIHSYLSFIKYDINYTNRLYNIDDIIQDEVITRTTIVDDSLLLCVCEFIRRRGGG